MVEVSLNGEKKELQKNCTVKEMLELFGYEEDAFAVAINLTFVSIKDYEKTIIKDGDKIDILSPMVGG